MNNKRLGTQFENEFCELLNSCGFCVHFCTPTASGKQPCDVIAAKDGEAYLIDCKTSVDDIFRYTRLELNQILAFEKWLKNGNTKAFIAVKHNGNVYIVPYLKLKKKGKVKLDDEFLFGK